MFKMYMPKINNIFIHIYNPNLFFYVEFDFFYYSHIFFYFFLLTHLLRFL